MHFTQNTQRAKGFVAAALECWEAAIVPARSPDAEMRVEDQRRAGFAGEIWTREVEEMLDGSA